MTTSAMPFTRSPLLLRPIMGLLILGVLASSLSVSAAALKDPGQEAVGGEGIGFISGFVISDIHYDLSLENPGYAEAVSISVVGADGRTVPSQVVISLEADGRGIQCVPAGGLRWDCPVRSSLAEAHGLRVSASS